MTLRCSTWTQWLANADRREDVGVDRLNGGHREGCDVGRGRSAGTTVLGRAAPPDELPSAPADDEIPGVVDAGRPTNEAYAPVAHRTEPLREQKPAPD